jgi:DNA-binding response OmpR family regulator
VIKPARILVVDDDRGIADSLECIFSMSGYEAVAVYSAAEALERARTFHPDVVIADVVMPPGQSGIDLAAELRNRNSGCGIILLSGNAGTQELLTQAGSNMDGVLVLAKPFPPRELLAIVAKFTNHRAA